MATHETANDPLDPSVLRAAAGRLRHCGADPGRDAHPRAGGGGHADADARPAEHPAVYGRPALCRGLPRLSGADGFGLLPADVFRRPGAAGAPHLGRGLLPHHPARPERDRAPVQKRYGYRLQNALLCADERRCLRHRLQRQRHFPGRDGLDHVGRRDGGLFAVSRLRPDELRKRPRVRSAPGAAGLSEVMRASAPCSRTRSRPRAACRRGCLPARHR